MCEGESMAAVNAQASFRCGVMSLAILALSLIKREGMYGYQMVNEPSVPAEGGTRFRKDRFTQSFIDCWTRR